MRLLLPYFILIIVLIQLKLRKNSKKESDSNSLYWARESKSNSVRKKDINNLPYISIPDTFLYERITSSNVTSDAVFTRESAVITKLRVKKILNLTGLSNTDLKLEYGVGNLASLTEYDDNYATLVKCIHNLSVFLLDNNYTKEAVELLEFSIATKSDISADYVALANYYVSVGEQEKIGQLIDTAGELKSMNKPIIISKLEALLKKTY